IGWRPSVRCQNPERTRHETRQRRQSLRFDIQDKIGEHERAAGFMKEIDSLEDWSSYQNVIDLSRPSGGRVLAEFGIDANAGRPNLRSLFQTGDCPSLCIRTGALPITKEYPVSDAWRNDVANRTECFDRVSQVVAIVSRRVQ